MQSEKESNLRLGKYKATIIGAIVTGLCLATTATFIVPILTIIPLGLPLEMLFSGGNYSGTSFGTLLSLMIIFIVSVRLFYKKIKEIRNNNHELSTSLLIVFFTAQLFIIHPLVFYIWATINAGNGGDGQFIFGVLDTFPISSFFFVILGIFIDGVKNKTT